MKNINSTSLQTRLTKGLRPLLRNTLLCILLAIYSVNVSAQVVFNTWAIESWDLTGAHLDLQASEVKSITFEVSVTRFLNSNQQYPNVNLNFKLARHASGVSHDISSLLNVGTNDFDGSIAEKSFTVSLTAIGGGGNGNALLRNGDKILLLIQAPNAPNGWAAATKTYNVAVELGPITGNVICCSKCITSGSAAGLLSQAPGTTVTGGDKVYKYVWKKSTNGTTFNAFEQYDNVNPGNLTQTTWFQRTVESSSTSSTGAVSPVSSNVVKIEVIDADVSPILLNTSYAQNTIKQAVGIMTIRGNQTPNTGVQVDFISDVQIVIKPSTIPSFNTVILSPNSSFSIAALCESEGGRIASSGINVNVTQPGDNSKNTEVSQDIASEERQTDQNDYIEIFPNPAKSEATITYRITQDGRAKLYITDTMGNSRILMDKSNIPMGSYEMVLNMTEFQSGLYFFTLSNNGEKSVRRVSILHE